MMTATGDVNTLGEQYIGSNGTQAPTSSAAHDIALPNLLGIFTMTLLDLIFVIQGSGFL